MDLCVVAVAVLVSLSLSFCLFSPCSPQCSEVFFFFKSLLGVDYILLMVQVKTNFGTKAPLLGLRTLWFNFASDRPFSKLKSMAWSYTVGQVDQEW